MKQGVKRGPSLTGLLSYIGGIMNRKESRLAVSGVFAVIIAWSVRSAGNGWIVSLGAGLLGGAVYWLVSRLIFD